MQNILLLIFGIFCLSISLCSCVGIIILLVIRRRRRATISDTAKKTEKKSDTSKMKYAKIIEVFPFWILFVDILMAELLTIFINIWGGIILYSIIFVLLLIYPAITTVKEHRNLIWGLSIIPLIRIISMSIPVGRMPQIIWYPILYLPLLIGSYAIMRVVGLKAQEVGFIKRGLPLQIIVGIIVGIGFGITEYLILKPEPFLSALTPGNIVGTSFVFLATTGLVEELIFRGILQKLIEPVMQAWWGIIYVSLIFAVLHIGFQSILDVIFVFIVALCFAFVVKKTGSLIGVILSHGTINVMLFVILPLIQG